MSLIIFALAVSLLVSQTCLTKELVPFVEGPLVPWLQPPEWKPVYADSYNSLPDLLKSRASPDHWVSLFCFSLPANRTRGPEEEIFFRMALNALYSYRAFGQASSDIVAALSQEALQECQKFRLPCLNATSYVSELNYKNIGWAKVKIAKDILKLGYHLHLSDLDLSYIKPIGPAIAEMFSWSNDAADGGMMTEQWVHQDDPLDTNTRRLIYLANLGVVFLRANERSIRFLDALLQFAGDKWQDQYIATWVAYQAWAPCTDEATCLAVRQKNMAAITLHPSQFANSNCLPEPQFSLCDWRRLYVHAVCRASARDKESFLRHTGAMFIDSNTAGPDGRDVVGRQDNQAIAKAGLPCPPAQQIAWRSPEYHSGRVVPDHEQGKGDGKGKAEGRATIKVRRLRGLE